MADLQRIQNCMDKLSSLIQEVEAMQEVADWESLKNRLLIWKSETDAVISTEYPNYTPEVEEFNRRWRISMIGNSVRNAVIRKLRNARTDLRFIMQADEDLAVIAGGPRHARPDNVIAGLTGNPLLRHSRLDRESLPEYAITDYAEALYGI